LTGDVHDALGLLDSAFAIAFGAPVRTPLGS
jgi:hypothetical protein